MKTPGFNTAFLKGSMVAAALALSACGGDEPEPQTSAFMRDLSRASIMAHVESGIQIDEHSISNQKFLDLLKSAETSWDDVRVEGVSLCLEFAPIHA